MPHCGFIRVLYCLRKLTYKLGLRECIQGPLIVRQTVIADILISFVHIQGLEGCISGKYF